MQIQFHGAVRTVTGSQHLLTINGKQILLDCGLQQGKRDKSRKNNRNLPFNAADVDLMILSHAHIDHSGNIPNLVKSGFDGDIICTYATRDLCSIMLRDSARIQQYDIQYLNRKRAKKGLPKLEPIYSVADALRSLEQFVGFGYNRPREIMAGVKLTFVDAGHILGSATVILDIEDKETGRDLRLVFSGDIGRPNRPILRDPVPVERADILIIESTYGDREHKYDAVDDDKLRDIVVRTCKKGGKLIIPAFAVGRTQEIVYRLHRLIEKGEISMDLPVYVDSPLAIDATGIYRLHPEGYDDEIAEFILTDRHRDAFGFDRMVYTRSTAQSKALNDIEGPAIIISASGMAEAGRIVHHLSNNIEDPNSTILIVGWQAPHTLGRRIVEKQAKVRILGREHQVKASVEVINGFSGHADLSELLDWVGHLKQAPEHTFIVHGDEKVSLNFAETLRKHGLGKVTVPQLGESFTV